VSAESDAATAALLREHQIDIAIDLKGYTGSARRAFSLCAPPRSKSTISAILERWGRTASII
jgi:hypothetical protein